jgi:diguanylate cyclase (GGDEF)-like protein
MVGITVIYSSTALLACIVAIFALRQRKRPGMVWLALMLLAAAEWSLGNALEISWGSIPGKILSAKLEYIGILTAPTFYFLFSLQYNRFERWLTKRLRVLLILDTILILLLVWTNEQHRLFWTNISPNPLADNALVFSHGPLFWASAALYSFLLIAVATTLLIWRAIQAPSIYRTNAMVAIGCSIIPVSGNLLYLLNWPPIAGYDPTPIAFCLCGSLMTFFMYRLRLFEIVPIARSFLVDGLPDGILVLDCAHRIVDLNPAALELLGWWNETPFGKPCTAVLPEWPQWERKFLTDRFIEFTPERNDSVTLELRAFPIRPSNQSSQEYLLVLRDMTKTKIAERELQKANTVLREQLEEIRLLEQTLRDQAVRDPLTGLYNRRYLAETLDREMARAQRLTNQVSVVIIDLDYFKDINDQFGHRAGDEILRMLSTILLHQTRRGDISCRYGGDEFVVIMPGATLQIAMRRGEEWRMAFSAAAFADGKREHANTFSAGIATYPQDGATSEEILAAADKALYISKSSGRNRISICG